MFLIIIMFIASLIELKPYIKEKKIGLIVLSFAIFSLASLCYLMKDKIPSITSIILNALKEKNK